MHARALSHVPRPPSPIPEMALLDRLRQELDRAGQTAQRAFDEGRIRLDLFVPEQVVKFDEPCTKFRQLFGRKFLDSLLKLFEVAHDSSPFG